MRDWALPAGVPLTPRAAERLSREAAVQAFAPAARALTDDWGMGPEHPMHASRVQRWSEAVGAGLVAARDAEVEAYGRGRRPEPPPNAVPLLVVGVDGGRWQGREKDEGTGSRWGEWHEDKVLTVSSYLPGDGKDPDEGGRGPEKLVTGDHALGHGP